MSRDPNITLIAVQRIFCGPVIKHSEISLNNLRGILVITKFNTRIVLLMLRDKHKMKVHPGNIKVVAESDGGLIIYPKPGRDCHYPVIIIEVILLSP